MTQYSLWDSPWVPVIDATGKSIKLGIRDTLVQAHQLREVFDQSPLVVVAINRLLQAVLYRVFSPWEIQDWIELWSENKFESNYIDSYGADYGEYFDLLHPTRPFYQVPRMGDEKVHPVSALLLEAASGNNPLLFDHGHVEGQDWLSLDRAACYLLSHQLFAVGGGVSKPFNRMDAPLTKGLVAFAKGNNLFEGLMLNLFPLEYWENFVPDMGNDSPFWEINCPEDPEKEGTIPNGPMYYLTWQSRQIHLCSDEAQERIVNCQILQRYALTKQGVQIDPGKPYQKDDKEGWKLYRLDRQSAVWQHAHILLQRDTSNLYLTTWLAKLHNKRKNILPKLPSLFDYFIVGLATAPGKAAKIDLWRKEQLSFPVDYLEDGELVLLLESMLLKTKYYKFHLTNTALALAWGLSKESELAYAIDYIWKRKLPKIIVVDLYRKIADSYGMVTRFWPALEEPFRKLLFALPVEKNTAKQDWIIAMERAARQSFYDVRDTLLHQRSTYHVLARVEDAFQAKLAKIRYFEEGEKDK